MTVLRLLLLSLVLVAAPIVPALPSEQAAAGATITHFYNAPDLDRVPELLARSIEAGGFKDLGSRGTLIGFLAALFVQHPERVSGWIAGQHSDKAQQVLTWALIMADRIDDAQAFARRHNWPANGIANLGRQTLRLATLPIRTGADQDLFWGASFATGDSTYVRRILDNLAEGSQSSTFEVEDILTAARVGRRPSQEELLALGRKYGQEKTMVLAVYAAALWSLASNAKQHPFVAQEVEARIAAAPASNLAYVLRRAVFDQQADIIANRVGGGIRVMVSHLSDTAVIDQPAGDGGFMQRVTQQFRNYFRRGQPVNVGLLIMLDPGVDCTYEYVVTTPRGQSRRLGPFTIGVSQQARIMGAATAIPPEVLSEPGVYTVSGAFTTGSGNAVTTENRILIGDR